MPSIWRKWPCSLPGNQPHYLIGYIGLSCPKKILLWPWKNTHHNFHSFENRCNFFSRWKLLLALLLNFDNNFLRLTGKLTEQITMLIYCRTKTLKRARDVSEARRTKFHGRADSSPFPSNRPLWTLQCHLLLVDNLTQPLPGWGPFWRRNAACNDSCVHFKWKHIPGKASFVFKRDFRRLKIGSGTHENEQRYAQDPRIRLWSFRAIRLLWRNLSNLKWGAVWNCFLPLINSKDSANMKNKNLNFSPKKLQTNLCAVLNVSLGCLWFFI